MADFDVRQAVHKVCPCALSASETEAKRTIICIKYALQSTVWWWWGDGGHKDKMHGTCHVTFNQFREFAVQRNTNELRFIKGPS